MMTDDEREIVDAGAIMRKLLATPGWKVYEDNIRAKLDAQRAMALAPGDTDYAKGAVFALGLVLNAPQATIDEATRILEREGVKEDFGVDLDKGETSP